MSLLRTATWVLVGCYLLGLLFPAPGVKLNQTYYNRKLPTKAVRDLVLDKNDPRGWKHLKKDPSKFTIAWIGTSTLQNVAPGNYRFIPADVVAQLPRIDGKPVQVNMYLFEGGRMMDIYAATADAVATKPDMVLVDMNPLWLFNDRQIQEWDNLDSAAFGDLVTDLQNWPLLAGLYSPSDAALAAASSHLGAIRNRWSYAQRLHDEINRLSPLNPPRIDPSVQRAKPTGLALVATMPSPLAFWNYYRPLVPLTSSPIPLQEALLRGARTDGSLINDDVVAALLQTLADSKIPSIAYMPPINPTSLNDPGVDSALRRIETHLAQIADKHRAPTLRVQSESAVRFLHGLAFKDLGHMSNDKPMVDYMAKLICSQLTAVTASTQCAPEPREATR